jgi:hypothetical protein
MTQVDAVFQACRELDVRTSVATLQARAEYLYGDSIHYNAVVSYRSRYRKKYKVKSDCRMLGRKGQWRRDMQNDHVATLAQVKRLNHYFGLKRPQIQSLLNLLGDGTERFHSVEQLTNAVGELVGLRQAA